MAPRQAERSSSVSPEANFGQRVRKRQPEGGLAGLGMSPSRTMRLRPRSLAGSGMGIAESRAWV